MKTDSIPMVSQDFLGERGIFYVGGEYRGEEGKKHICNQMFVEAYKPKEMSYPYPLILFHGAGQTNVGWLTTPDGRMGWADYFVSKGFFVLLAEQPARGRSAYHPAENGPRIFHPAEILADHFTTDSGSWPQAALHTQWPGSEPGPDDETFRQFAASQVEYLPDNGQTQRLVLDAGLKLLEKTGPAVLLTHSQAGPFGWLLADSRPDLVKGIVALEPSGPPFSRNLSDRTARNYGIADLPLCYEPPVRTPDEIELELLKSTGKERNDGWVMKEPARKLPNLRGIPVLLLASESSYHAGYDHLTSYVLNQAGVNHDFVRLEDVGIHGNGHMMMLEKNNLEIAEYIQTWLKNNS